MLEPHLPKVFHTLPKEGSAPVADYAFFSVWEIAAPIDRVWGEISSPERYPEWFPYVKEARQVSLGDDAGMGSVTRSQWTTALPYGFVLETSTTRSERPHLLELAASGDLEGTGRWELVEDEGVTSVRYYWTVRTTKPWMNLLAPLAGPAFGWNHAVLMRAGGEGLAARLGARLIGNRSYSADSTNPLVPLSATAGLFSSLVLLPRWVRRVISVL